LFGGTPSLAQPCPKTTSRTGKTPRTLNVFAPYSYKGDYLQQ